MTRTYAYIPNSRIDDALRLGWLPCAYAAHWSVLAEWLCDCAPRMPNRPHIATAAAGGGAGRDEQDRQDSDRGRG